MTFLKLLLYCYKTTPLLLQNYSFTVTKLPLYCYKTTPLRSENPSRSKVKRAPKKGLKSS
ncbi:hypothetical protein BUZ80_11685 [Staphylococcus saprophyticus]|nr:hypothetical protein BUZ80_11685 [Staphylococcus saprophyticus]